MSAVPPSTSSRLEQGLGLEGWRQHRFGLSERRWQRLAGRIIVVTGAGTGIGQALSLALAAAGAQVILCGRRPDRLMASLAAMAGAGIDPHRCRALPLDIRDPAKVAAAIDDVFGALGPIAGVVNSAALPPPPAGPQALLDTSPAQWAALLETNVTGAWLMTRAALRRRLAKGFRAVFLTSAAGWGFAPGAGPYNVSKAALNSLAASFAIECASAWPGDEIQINALDPGQVRSEMNAGSDVSPYTAIGMILLLLSHGSGGPNGRFFRSDGSSLPFGHAGPYDGDLLAD